MDVTSLHTSIPHDGALKASKHFLDIRSNQSMSTSTLLQLIDLVLKMNPFHFNGRCFSQKQGVALGTKIGPSVACLFMGYLEELFFADYEHSTPKIGPSVACLFMGYLEELFFADYEHSTPKIGPSVACLFMGYLEELFFAYYEHSTPMRYIDEIVGAATCREEVLL